MVLLRFATSFIRLPGTGPTGFGVRLGCIEPLWGLAGALAGFHALTAAVLLTLMQRQGQRLTKVNNTGHFSLWRRRFVCPLRQKQRRPDLPRFGPLPVPVLHWRVVES